MKRSSRTNLKAGFFTGLVISTFSTLFVTLGGRHVGRDPKQDFMQVAMWILGDRAIDEEPSRRNIAAGVASHSFADFFWASIFFGLILPRLGPDKRRAILASAVPWAVGTAAAEYYVFLPWIQPWLPMQVPFWTVASVHLSSGAAYPLFPWIRNRLTGTSDAQDRRLGRRTGGVLAGITAVLGALWWWCRRRGDPRWPGVEADSHEARFLHHMAGHHDVGLRLSHLAARRGENKELRDLGTLMAAQHKVELDLMHHWYRSWFDDRLRPLSADERAAMDGMPDEHELDSLARLDGEAFDRRFLQLMIPHHEGAIQMSEELLGDGGDPRVRLLADGIRHSQYGQIDEMRKHVRG